jgi:ferredoxin
MCIMYDGSTFAHDDETKAVVTQPQSDSAQNIATATEACLTRAITRRPRGREEE